jgi:hypothetical protein
MGEPAVTRADVDRDPAREAGQGVPKLLVGALEALAAYGVHRAIVAEPR